MTGIARRRRRRSRARGHEDPAPTVPETADARAKAPTRTGAAGGAGIAALGAYPRPERVGRGCTIPAMLDHEEKFLFKEEIGQLGAAMADTAVLDNVEDLLTDVITSPRFDSEVFTLERSLQVDARRACRQHARWPADRDAGGLRGGRRRSGSRRRCTSASWRGGPLRPRDRQRPELPEQPGRDPGPLPSRPRSPISRTGGSSRVA